MIERFGVTFHCESTVTPIFLHPQILASLYGCTLHCVLYRLNSVTISRTMFLLYCMHLNIDLIGFNYFWCSIITLPSCSWDHNFLTTLRRMFLYMWQYSIISYIYLGFNSSLDRPRKWSIIAMRNITLRVSKNLWSFLYNPCSFLYENRTLPEYCLNITQLLLPMLSQYSYNVT